MAFSLGSNARRGAFRPARSDSPSRHRSTTAAASGGYQGQVDAFGVFCPDDSKCYLIPIADLPLSRQAHLRLIPARNAQSKGVRWAQEYELQ
jgi:hypothetical protein